jgi:transcriptional activator SPT8
VRSYPTHGAQISSLALRPITQGTDKEPEKKGANGDALPHVSVNVGPDFFKADREADGDAVMAEEKKEEANGQEEDKPAESEKDAAGEDDDADSLFDDDADGEDESKPATPALQALGLALPGAKPPSSSATPAPAPAATPAPRPATKPSAKIVAGAAASIPLLTPTEYKAMSNDILLTSSMDGQVTLFDRREGGAVGRLVPGDRAPPWCMSVSGSAFS